MSEKIKRLGYILTRDWPCFARKEKNKYKLILL